MKHTYQRQLLHKRRRNIVFGFLLLSLFLLFCVCQVYEYNRGIAFINSGTVKVYSGFCKRWEQKTIHIGKASSFSIYLLYPENGSTLWIPAHALQDVDIYREDISRIASEELTISYYEYIMPWHIADRIVSISQNGKNILPDVVTEQNFSSDLTLYFGIISTLFILLCLSTFFVLSYKFIFKNKKRKKKRPKVKNDRQ